MTFPHIDPDFKHNSNLPDHLQPDYIQRVFYVNNAVMEVVSGCKNKEADCLECGNAECFMIFEEKAKLLNVPLKWLMTGWRQQRQLDEKAAEAQAKRFAYYEQRYRESLVTKPKTAEPKGKANLFDFQEAA